MLEAVGVLLFGTVLGNAKLFGKELVDFVNLFVNVGFDALSFGKVIKCL